MNVTRTCSTMTHISVFCFTKDYDKYVAEAQIGKLDISHTEKKVLYLFEIYWNLSPIWDLVSNWFEKCSAVFTHSVLKSF